MTQRPISELAKALRDRQWPIDSGRPDVVTEAAARLEAIGKAFDAFEAAPLDSREEYAAMKQLRAAIDGVTEP